MAKRPPADYLPGPSARTKKFPRRSAVNLQIDSEDECFLHSSSSLLSPPRPQTQDERDGAPPSPDCAPIVVPLQCEPQLEKPIAAFEPENYDALLAAVEQTVNLARQFQGIARELQEREMKAEWEVAQQTRKWEVMCSEVMEKSAIIDELQRRLHEQGRELRIREGQLEESREREALLKVAINTPVDMQSWADSSRNAMWKEMCVLVRKVYAYEARGQ